MMTHPFAIQIAEALGADMDHGVQPQVTSPATSPSHFDTSALAVASVAAAASELAAVMGAQRVEVDQRWALMWFGMTLRPEGWEVPAPWDPIAGDYQARDGWIRLHTNASHHRDAALSVLHCDAQRDAVGVAVARLHASELETAVVGAGGAAAAMRDLSAWAAHAQGQSVAQEPLIAWDERASGAAPVQMTGLRVLDLTRVLAGPVATRFLAGFGADVLRIDPPEWDEPAVVPEVTLGKRCAALDLTNPADRAQFEALLRDADVVVHGYRKGALAGLGYGPDALAELAPHVIEVTLNAYGWTGPWAGRRGFDSLVQMSCGIAAEGMVRAQSAQPKPLPVQALDHATGYLMAAAVLRALRIRRATGRVMRARLSLARTGALLTSGGVQDAVADIRSEGAQDLAPDIEQTGWGPARRIAFPVTLDGHAPAWPRPSGPLHRDAAVW